MLLDYLFLFSHPRHTRRCRQKMRWKELFKQTTRLEINIALTKSADSAEAVALTNRWERSPERKSESTV